MIVNALELGTDQPPKLAITTTIDRAEGMINRPQKCICGVEREHGLDPAVYLVGTIEQSVDLTQTCRCEVGVHL